MSLKPNNEFINDLLLIYEYNKDSRNCFRIFDPTHIFNIFPTSLFLSGIKLLFKNLEFLRENSCSAMVEEENFEWSEVLKQIKKKDAIVFACKIEDLLMIG